jgi:DNA-binding NarL/FixJ family response regulator
MAGGQSGTALGISFGVLLREQRSPTSLERKRWPCLAAHLGAGLRLRAAAKRLDLDAEPVEAVLDSCGKVHDARLQATSPSARESLRRAVCRIERARTAQERSDPDAAMESWQGLVDGRWSLVDRFDTDGKRFVVAVRNDPAHPDPRGLTMREREVAEFVGLGRSTKEVSYTLGVSLSAVTNLTATAQAKLGLCSRAELAAFFAPGGLRAKLAEVALSGEQLLVGAYPLVNKRQVEKLTDAEREVVAHLVAGSTNSDIARRRRTSENTVANQVHSIFLKLGARSRSELAARLQERA